MSTNGKHFYWPRCGTADRSERPAHGVGAHLDDAILRLTNVTGTNPACALMRRRA
jgi:hypothetical protein